MVDVTCGDELSLVAAHFHDLQHTFAWENTAVKASAPGRASREILGMAFGHTFDEPSC